MDIKDYIHFYIGQKVKAGEGSWIPITGKLIDLILEIEDTSWYKLCLRQIESITEEEAREIILHQFNVEKTLKNVTVSGNVIDFTTEGLLGTSYHSILLHKPNPMTFIKLLSMGFDLFDLIPAGLAVEFSPTKTEQP